jgi:hypothetical protein
MLRNPWGQGEWKGDWSDASSLWTEELRIRYNVVSADDGCFYIPFEDYLREYVETNICSEIGKSKYNHSSAFVEFSRDTSPMPQAFFKFSLDHKVDFNKEVFAISVSQQGDRLG